MIGVGGVTLDHPAGVIQVAPSATDRPSTVACTTFGVLLIAGAVVKLA
jgi:hypothetical protein